MVASNPRRAVPPAVRPVAEEAPLLHLEPALHLRGHEDLGRVLSGLRDGQHLRLAPDQWTLHGPVTISASNVVIDLGNAQITRAFDGPAITVSNGSVAMFGGRLVDDVNRTYEDPFILLDNAPYVRVNGATFFNQKLCVRGSGSNCQYAGLLDVNTLAAVQLFDGVDMSRATIVGCRGDASVLSDVWIALDEDCTKCTITGCVSPLSEVTLYNSSSQGNRPLAGTTASTDPTNVFATLTIS